MSETLTPEQMGREIAERWWRVGREMHAETDLNGVWVSPKELLGNIAADVIKARLAALEAAGKWLDRACDRLLDGSPSCYELKEAEKARAAWKQALGGDSPRLDLWDEAAQAAWRKAKS